MPAPFKQIDRRKFAALLDKFEFTRKMNAVHMHHTWRPNQSQVRHGDGHRSSWGCSCTIPRRTAGRTSRSTSRSRRTAASGRAATGTSLRRARSDTTATRPPVRSCSRSSAISIGGRDPFGGEQRADRLRCDRAGAASLRLDARVPGVPQRRCRPRLAPETASTTVRSSLPCARAAASSLGRRPRRTRGARFEALPARAPRRSIRARRVRARTRLGAPQRQRAIRADAELDACGARVRRAARQRRRRRARRA